MKSKTSRIGTVFERWALKFWTGREVLLYAHFSSLDVALEVWENHQKKDPQFAWFLEES